ncbi:RNA 2',3'-cyclic phosphodiesterase [Candidatus Omnitrophota bacterium]
MLRSFIALELSEEIHRQLKQAQDQLKAAQADVKWVDPQGIHLTLRFLGNVSPQLLEEIKPQLEELGQSHRQFKLEIKQLGAFPKIEYPRVIWIGIEQGKDRALKLAEDLEQRLLNFGFQKEKREFKPHLTLGRVRSAQNREQLKNLLQSVTITPSAMQAVNLCLFKSTLTPQGAIYQPLHKTQLS